MMQSVHALEIEKFFMPGDVISGHAKFESECTRCHVRMRDTTQEKLCIDCHEPIGEDLGGKRGFHGLDRLASSQPCSTCHGDHKGRDARIVQLDPDVFDHRQTDFVLEGKHQLAQCDGCHEPGSKFREAPQECHTCHAEDDAHRGGLGKKCGQCHAASGWSKSGFDHDRTGFRLKFSHRQAACGACHLQADYRNTPKQCVGCHAIRDVHEKRFGSRCHTCHSEQSWNKIRFDHGKASGFSLLGKHRLVSCNACHTRNYQANRQDGKVRSCYSCHRQDDSHQGANGKQCQDCHVADSWNRSTFDHDKKTDFPLRGGHRELACGACHAADTQAGKIDAACASCHQQDDAHLGSLGANCQACHNDSSWLGRVRFDHDLASFPLLGQHAVAGCESCHPDSTFKGTDDSCIACHRDDDVHRRALGENCISCHNPNAWLLWRFDHDTTSFSLRGAHQQTHCHSCHTPSSPGPSDRNWRCIDCHRRDDVHEGNFGGQCGKCHNQTSFENPEIRSMKTFQTRISGITP